LPFSFDAGLNQLMTAMQQGATLVLQNWLFAKDIVHVLREERITGLAGVPCTVGSSRRLTAGTV
jgi:hypothetical protein